MLHEESRITNGTDIRKSIVAGAAPIFQVSNTFTTISRIFCSTMREGKTLEAKPIFSIPISPKNTIQKS